MFIKVNNISDFLGFIQNLVGNGESDIRVFTSCEESSWLVGNNKDNIQTKFTFVILSHIFQVIYSDSVNTDEYEKIFRLLTEYQDNLNACFRILQFEKIKIDKNYTHLTIEKELNVI